MAIETNLVGSSLTLVYNSVGQTAITLMSLCNYSVTDQVVSVHIVKSFEPIDYNNLFISNLTITAGDTYVLYQGGEKIILDNTDEIYVISSSANSVNSIISYMVI